MKHLALCALLACGSPSPPAVNGTVTDGANAMAGATVQVCNETLCTLGTADAQGAFSVTVPAGTGYHVIAHAPKTETRATSAALAIVGDVSETVALPPIVIPIVGTLEGLSTNATSALGVSIPQSQWPAFNPPGETIVAMWALAPWATHAPGTTLAIANHFGLAPNATARVFAVDDTTASLLPPTQATVTADGASITGATVDRLTWVVVAVP